MPRRGDQQVVRLQVAVDDPARVAVLQREHDLRRVLPAVVLPEAPELPQQRVEVAADGVLGDDVQVPRGGEGVVELHDEGIVCLDQRVPLRHRLRDHVLVHQVLLADHLHRVHVPGGALAAQVHLAVRAARNALEHLEVLDGRRRAAAARRARRRSARATPEQSARPTPGRRRDPETGAERHHRRSLASRRDRRRLASATDDPCRTAIRNGIRCRSRRRRPNREESQRTRGATRRPDAQTGTARRCLNPRRPAALSRTCVAAISVPTWPAARADAAASPNARAKEETTSITSSVSARSARRALGSVADSRKRDFFVPRGLRPSISRVALFRLPLQHLRHRRGGRGDARGDVRAGGERAQVGVAHRRAAPRVLGHRRVFHRLLAHAAHDVPLRNLELVHAAGAKCAFASTCTSAPAFAL